MRFLFLLALLAPSLAQTNYLLQTFELDGNAVDSPAGGPVDWTPTLFSGGAPLGANTFGVDDRGGITVFTGGQTKDTRDFSQWAFQNTGSVPPKDDFNNAFGATFVTSGQILAFFGGDMLATGTGTATFGVWFLQNHIALSGGGFTGAHTINDVLLVIDMSGDRRTINVAAYTWQGVNNLQPIIGESTANFRCDIPLSANSGVATVCAIANTADITNIPMANDLNNFNAPAATWWEGGVNFNQLFGGAANVPCFSSIIIESRASNSPTSTLQDFILHDFNICSVSTSSSCGFVADNGAGQFTATYTVTVTNTGAASATVNSIATQNLPAGATITPPSLPFTIAAGASHDFVIVYNNLPAAGFSPQVLITFASPGPAAKTESATCPLLRISAAKTCHVSVHQGTLSSPVSATALYVQVDWTVTVTNLGDVAVGSCSVVENHGTPVTFSSVTFAEGGTTIASQAHKSFTQNYLPQTASGSLTFPDSVSVTCAPTTGGTARASATSSASCSLCP